MGYDYENDPAFNFGSYAKKSGLKLEGLDPVLSERLKNANEEWLSDPRNKAGTDIPVTSYARDRKTAKDLYERHKRGEKGIYMPVNPDDYPNQQMFHTNAVDISQTFPEDLLHKHGLHKPFGKKDPVHVQANPAYKAPSAVDPYSEENPAFGFGKYVSNPDQEEADLSKPATYNPRLAAQGQRMREQGSKLQPFVEDVAKPLEGTTLEDLKNSTPYLAARANLGGAEGKKEMVERVGAGSEKFVKGVQDFINAPNKMEIIKQGLQNLYEHPGEAVGEAVKSTFMHPEQIPAGNAVAKVAGKVLEKGAGAVKGIAKEAFQDPEILKAVDYLKGKTGEVTQKAKTSMKELQEGFQEAKQATEPKAKVTVEAAPTEFQGAPNVGAAATEHENQVRALLDQMSPESRAELEKVPPHELEIPALENQRKFDKFGMRGTKGQLSEDVARMSDEWNQRTLPGNEELLDRFVERDPKLIQGMNDIQERAAPEIFTKDIKDLGQIAIDDLVKKDAARLADIENKYRNLEAANGGQFPIDVNQLSQNIDKALKSKLKSKYYESGLSEIKHEIDNFVKEGHMTFEDYENLRTNLAQEMRSSSNGNVRQAAHLVRQELENLPMPKELEHIKPLADEARKAVVERNKVLESNPAYRAATKDTRDIHELQNGMEHVGADKFIEKYVLGNTDAASKANVQRLIQELGQNSQGHQAIKAGTLQHLKHTAGIVDDKGAFGQAAYNKFIHKNLGSKLEDIMEAEHVSDVKDLGDVARLTEHRKGGAGFANTSNTQSVGAREAAKNEAKELAKNVTLGTAEAALNTKTLGIGGTLLRKTYGGWKAGKETERAAAEQAAKLRETLDLGSAARKHSLSDIQKGKQ
jgi:hypothetical protein